MNEVWERGGGGEGEKEGGEGEPYTVLVSTDCSQTSLPQVQNIPHLNRAIIAGTVEQPSRCNQCPYRPLVAPIG